MNCYLGVDIGSISTKGVIIDENNLKLLKYPTGNKREEYITPEKVTSVVNHAFLDTFYLKKITFSGYFISCHGKKTTLKNKRFTA